MKNKVLLLFLSSLLFAVSFLVACWVFLSWDQVGRYVLNFTASQMEDRGVTLNYEDLEVSRGLNPVFHIEGMEMISFAGTLKIRDTYVSLNAPRSIGRLGLALDLSIPALVIEPRVGGITRMTSGGEGALFFSRELLQLHDLDFRGDISISGGARYHNDSGKIESEGLVLEVPEEMDKNLEVLRGYLPVKKIGSGKWGLK